MPSSSDDADHDVVKAMIKWVEKGVPPERIVATQYTNNDPTQPVVRQRPLCSYPDEPRYKGHGDINDASSFTCEAPKTSNLVPTEAEMNQIRYSIESRKIPVPTTH